MLDGYSAEIIAAIYDSGIHCIAHAEERFGSALYRDPRPVDRSGNPVGLLSRYELESGAGPEGEYCDDDGKELVPPVEEENDDED